MDEPEETVSKRVESTAVPPPPPSPEQEPAATAGKMSTVVDESVQAVADLLVAEGLAGPPSNISTLHQPAAGVVRPSTLTCQGRR